MALRVLVSVLSYKNVDSAASTLENLRSQTYLDFDIIVVDNASGSAFVQELTNRFTDLQIVVRDQNDGYTGGNNVAIEIGSKNNYDYVVICNDDIELRPDAIERIVETASVHPDAGVVGIVEECYFTGQRRKLGGRGFCMWTSRARWLPIDSDILDRVTKVDYVQGAVVMFTKRAIDAGIRLNTELFGYYDEVDLGFRLKASNLSAYADGRLAVRHKDRPNRFSYVSGYLMQRNRVYIVRKFGRWYHKMFCAAYLSLVEVPFKVALRATQGRWRFALACLLGHWDGMRGLMGRGRIERLAQWPRR